MKQATFSSREKRDRSKKKARIRPDAQLGELWRALRGLDRRLQLAVAAARKAHESNTGSDPYRGLYITQPEAEALVAREPGIPALVAKGESAALFESETSGADSRLDWLMQRFGLCSFEIDAIVLALAPELDLRYERLYAFLQDDVTRKRPSIDLALNLFCSTPEERIERRRHFSSQAPLLRHGIVRLFADPNQLQPPLLAHNLKLDAQIAAFLLRERSLDARLAGFCRLIEPTLSLADLPLGEEVKRGLRHLAAQTSESSGPRKLYFRGPRGAGKRRAAEALAAEAGASLLSADLARAISGNGDFADILRLVFREAWLQGAVLYLDNLDALRADGHGAQYELLLDALADDGGTTILGGVEPWVPSRGRLGVTTVPFATLDFAERRQCWLTNLEAVRAPIDTYDLDTLAGRFRLTAGQIAEAVATAANESGWRSATDSAHPSLAAKPLGRDLFAAARLQTRHDLAPLAHRMEPVYSWPDIVLPPDELTQLREICQRVAHRHRVLDEWGFDRKLSQGKGVNALFAGPSGTGKTMAAEIIARELELDLYKIDLSGVVSKYIGETEKNLHRIFRAAEHANAILFFDEADALFGKRSEVRDSHDRYANIEISYLLQQMEAYDGLSILATNLRKNLDDAFVRRLAFAVPFPFPDEASRLRIWQQIWPREIPLAADVDMEALARQFKLSGGNIKNIALAAAFLAAEDGGAVTMAHLMHATRREHQKMGKLLSEVEQDSARLKGNLVDSR
jgi:AAA+ superfamily predicted ATPase